MPVSKELSGAARWPGLQSLGAAILYCIRDGKETIQARFFIISLAVNVKQFGRAVRNHWSIENTCHWCLDVTCREDESRIRDKNLRENFAWLNRFSLSLLKQIPIALFHPNRDISRPEVVRGWSVLQGQGWLSQFRVRFATTMTSGDLVRTIAERRQLAPLDAAFARALLSCTMTISR